ncbi:MAG: hypothetical protein J5778_10580 [Clostridiales bacterium]|nr:hypothetical protein [Clostridiales bacterium]
MTSLASIVGLWKWYIICGGALILVACSLHVVINYMHGQRRKAPLIVSILNLILVFVLLLILMDCGKCFTIREFRTYSSFQMALFDMPYYLYAIVEFFSTLTLIALLFESLKYRGKHLTADSIQLAVDALPEGISISSPDGTVRLSNITYSNLCRDLTGKALSDNNLVWSFAEFKGKEQAGAYLVRFPKNKVWFYEKERIDVEGEEYYQITATDVTESYRIIEELEDKNEHLQDIRRRIKNVSDLSGDMFIAQEEADARAALHNQLGQVLLMGRHYINHKENTDSRIVYAATMQMNRFLLGEIGEPYEGESDLLTSAIAMANSIGVKVEISGAEPDDGRIRSLLAMAVTECSANTVKHAEGDIVKVDIDSEDEGGRIVILITNNGKVPRGKITESGGLLSLRRNVEKAGGIMILESEPRFSLMMRFSQDPSKNGTNG